MTCAGFPPREKDHPLLAIGPGKKATEAGETSRGHVAPSIAWHGKGGYRFDVVRHARGKSEGDCVGTPSKMGRGKEKVS